MVELDCSAAGLGLGRATSSCRRCRRARCKGAAHITSGAPVPACATQRSRELTVRQARAMLTGWAAEQDAVGSRRDQVVQAAIDAGLSKSEVHRLTGMARTTIDRILGTLPALEQDPR